MGADDGERDVDPDDERVVAQLQERLRVALTPILGEDVPGIQCLCIVKMPGGRYEPKLFDIRDSRFATIDLFNIEPPSS